MLERDYQRVLIQKIRDRFPTCIVLLPDPTYIQGFPDILLLFDEYWAALEVKRSKSAPVRPNQGYFVDILNEMSFASFIYPENEEEVLDELQQSLSLKR